MTQISRRNALTVIAGLSASAATNTVFAQNGNQRAQQVPVTGTHHAELKPFDEMMIQFVEKHKVPGAALAISRHSKIVYARGFGWAHVESKQAVQPDTLFRIASVSKPFTAVAVLQLAAASKFKLNDHLFDLLPATEWLPEKYDPRLREITIHQLLQHTAGWDRDVSFEPIIRPQQISKVLHRPLPVGPADVVRFTLTLKLDHNPGECAAYSNVGYLMLGRLIEHVTGQPYQEYVKEHVLKPVGITRMQLGRAWSGDLAKGETHYYDARHREEPAVNGPHLNVKVPIVYGAENLEAFEAHGGWIASAIDLVKFASAFDQAESSKLLPAHWISTMWARPEGLAGHEADGKPRPVYYGCGWQVRQVGDQGQLNTWHNGLIAGTSSLLVRRHDGLDWAVLFNTDEDSHENMLSDLIDPLVHQAADAIKRWPDHVISE
jgi:N-acyl-D-amino-acid deacylase